MPAQNPHNNLPGNESRRTLPSYHASMSGNNVISAIESLLKIQDESPTHTIVLPEYQKTRWGNFFTAQKATFLTKIIFDKETSLTVDDYDDIEPPTSHIEALILVLSRPHSLKFLCLPDGAVDGILTNAELMFNLATAALTSPSKLEHINLDEAHLTKNQAFSVVNHLNINPNLRTLDLSRSEVYDEALALLADRLRSHTSLKMLTLNYLRFDRPEDRFTPWEKQSIQQILTENKSLEELDLSSNNLEDSAAEMIAEGLKVNNTLKKLYLSYTQITDVGATAIANALRTNTTLTLLNIEGNWAMTGAGETALRQAASQRLTIELRNQGLTNHM